MGPRPFGKIDLAKTHKSAKNQPKNVQMDRGIKRR
jgi:hypothetical protein